MSAPSIHKHDAITLRIFVADDDTGEAIDLTDTEIYAIVNGATESPIDAVNDPDQILNRGYADLDIDSEDVTVESGKIKLELVWIHDTIAGKERTIFYETNFFIKPSDK